MQHQRPCWISLALLMLLVPLTSTAAPPTYTLTDLGPTAIPVALDHDSPTAVGVTEVAPAGHQTATEFTPAATVLGTLPGGNFSDASGICGSFQVGRSSTGHLGLLTHAWRRSGTGPLEDLGTLGVPDLFSAALDVNCAMTAVGFAETPARLIVPVVYAGTQTTILATLGSGEGHASAINAQGDIAGGYRTLSGQTHCALWPSSGGMVDCHTSTVATSFSTGLDINTPGQVVGFATTSQGQRGFVWLPLILYFPLK